MHTGSNLSETQIARYLMIDKIINIGVTGTGSLIGQAIIKCINLSPLKNNIELVGFDYIAGSVGSYWCKHNYLLPDIFKKNAKEETWLDEVLTLIKKHSLQVLFVGIDFELPVFAKHRKQIEEQTGCHVIVSSEEVIRIADDKYLTADFLKENNLPYPLSFTKEEYKTGTFSFPLIIKPRIGFRSVGFNLIRSQEQYEKVLQTVNDPVIQECVGDMDSEYTCGIIFLDGKLQASIALNRTLKEGNTFTASYDKNTPQVIYSYLEQVSKKLKPYGVINFQLRIDSHGTPKIFEINARHSGTTYMRALFGYNEVEFIISYLLKLSLPDMKNLTEGKVVRYFEEFLVKK
jgi:carbamoyl-phosphate synthase large subunit